MNTLTALPKAGHFVPGSSDDAMTVCVLDDEPGMVEMLQESLRCLGFSSIGTSDPQFALDLVGQGRVRVVMSDIKMPGMDGLQFLEQAMRIDSGVYGGWRVPADYDSLLAKLIVHAPTRQEAIIRMRRALDEFIVAGIRTNIDLHKALMNDPEVVAGTMTTRTIERLIGGRS